jgi:hypothetical protein
MVATGFDVIIKIVSGGTCACSGDVTSLTGGTCTKIPYLDSYDFPWSRALIEYTGFGDNIAKNLPGMPTVNLNFSGGLDLTDSTMLAFWNGIVCSAPAQKMLKVRDGGKIITAKGYLTGLQIGSTPSGKSTFSANVSLTQLPKTC